MYCIAFVESVVFVFLLLKRDVLIEKVKNSLEITLFFNFSVDTS